jgi:hypothetical protein
MYIKEEGWVIHPECSIKISLHHPNRRKNKPNSERSERWQPA